MKNQRFFNQKFVLTPKFPGCGKNGNWIEKSKIFNQKFVLAPKFPGCGKNGDWIEKSKIFQSRICACGSNPQVAERHGG
ncbi:MAG: hypothetical protein NC331_10355 [Lachnospiraceae bacterium]|nr:hypothetical protein [Lachnospiraceae bacterium]